MMQTASFSIRISMTLLIALILSMAAFIIPAPATGQSENNSHDNPLFIDPATVDFSGNPELLERIIASPHGYFRFINILFSKEVCARFQSMLLGTPSFNLHGDAHIEQYAMTDLGRGLTDFDDSSTGPAVLDLMRFGVSLHLTCRTNGWEAHADSLYETFLMGYREALNNPQAEAPVPSLVSRVKEDFKFDRVKYFEWVASIMQPLSEADSRKLLKAMNPYFENMLFEKKNLKKGFFEVVQTGLLKLGIGSAQDIKYLVRVEGESLDPYDDVVLEVKQVRDLSEIDCITVAQSGDPFRVLIGQARIAYEPYKFLGYIRLNKMNFWVHSWVDNYKEVDLTESFSSVQELAEIAYDVGIQLGRGHTNQIAAPLDIQLRREQLRLLAEHEGTLKATCYDLTDLTIAAWRAFRKTFADDKSAGAQQ